MKKKIIYIKWLDSWTRGGWHDQEKYEEKESRRAHPCESVGFLLSENEKVISIAGSISDVNTTCGEVITIPKVNIVGKLQLLGWSEEFK